MGGFLADKGLMYIVLYISLLIVFYYVFIVIPGKKRRAAHDAMQKSVAVGDEIVTVGGICGTVLSADEQKVTIKSGESVIEVLRSAIQIKVQR